MSTNAQALQSLENRVTNLVFSSNLAPGIKITERDLARSLGLSRIPVREALGKLVSRGILVKNDKNGSVHLRNYSAEEVTELFEMREALEVAAARLACQKATEADLLQMEVVCEQMEQEIGNLQSVSWSDLDRLFHEAMVQASQNTRLINSFGALLCECHYVFYRDPAHWGYPVGSEPGREQKSVHEPKREMIAKRTEQMLEISAEHRKILECIRAKEADAVQNLIRTRMQQLASGFVRCIVSRDLAKRNRSRLSSSSANAKLSLRKR